MIILILTDFRLIFNKYILLFKLKIETFIYYVVQYNKQGGEKNK